MSKLHKLNILLTHKDGETNNGNYNINSDPTNPVVSVNISYSHKHTNIVVNQEVKDKLDEIKDNCEEITLPMVTINKSKKFYFAPDTKFPRQQFKQLKEAHGVSVTRDINKADYIVVGENFDSQVSTDFWCANYCHADSLNTILKYLDFVKISEEDKEIIKDAIAADDMFSFQAYQQQEFFAKQLLKIRNNAMYSLNDKGTIEVAITKLKSSSSYLKKLNKVSDYQLIQEIYDHSNNYCYGKFPLVFNTNLLSEIIDKHIDKITIDKEQYDSLDAMFKSSDQDNHVLAMEIMANCDFKNSLVYIEKLFIDYSYEIYEARTSNHVNFMNLRELVNRGSNYDLKNTKDFDHSMAVLEKYDMLTLENLKLLLDTHKDHLLKLISCYSDYFEIKSLTLNNKCLEKWNYNYIYNMKPDFKPLSEEDLIIEQLSKMNEE